jgi:hypothetical protein
MNNDGLRITIDRHGSKFHWTITDRGLQYEGNRGYDSISQAAHEAEQFHRQVKASRLAKEKESRHGC